MNQLSVQSPKVENFDVEYTFKVSTIEKEKRVMSFVDSLWGIEVTGGIDQFEPLTIVAVKKTGLARRAGIRVGDVITMINDTPADNLTMLQAQREIHESGRFVKIFVKGDVEESSEDEVTTVDFWFKPLKKHDLEMIEWEKKREQKRGKTAKLYQGFPWNERKKPTLRTSNCFMVTQKVDREIKLRASKEQFNASERRDQEQRKNNTGLDKE
ncbi:unnamed protein product [Diamesa tonsa]